MAIVTSQLGSMQGSMWLRKLLKQHWDLCVLEPGRSFCHCDVGNE